MLRKLMPRENDFFDYFERHAATTLTGCRELLDLAIAGSEFEARAKRIKDLEHEADSITHDCVEALHKTFITPLDRDDIHMLISRMDDIMDFVETVSDLCVLYNIDRMTPDEIAKRRAEFETLKSSAPKTASLEASAAKP